MKILKKKVAFLNPKFRTFEDIPQIKTNGLINSFKAIGQINKFIKSLNIKNEFIVISNSEKKFYKLLLKYSSLKKGKDTALILPVLCLPLFAV